MSRRVGSSVAAVLVAGIAASTGAALAQDAKPAEAGEAAVASPWRPAVPLTRADVARGYTALERALDDRPPAGEVVAAINRQFDEVTFAFFRGDRPATIRLLHALMDSVEGGEPGAEEQLARSLRVELSPAVWVAGSREPIRVRVTSAYRVRGAEGADGAAAAAVPWRVRLRREDGTGAAIEWPVSGRARVGDAVDVEGVVTEEREFPAAPGRYSVRVEAGDLGSAVVGTLQVVSRSLGARREAIRKRLDAVEREHPERAAAAVARSRAGLLDDDPSADNPAQFLADLEALAGAVEAETAAIERGENPYRERVGDWYRGIAVAPGVVMPARVFAPPRAAPGTGGAGGGQPRPLVIALHGAGGDENMFMDAYGRGLIKRLAEREGFVVVSPRTETLATNPAALGALLDAMTADYAIDPARVYLVGHSMGGVVGASLARRDAGRIAAAACLAGGPRGAFRAPCAPLLVIAGGEDTVMVPSGLEAGVTRAREGGVDAEYRVKPGLGHTLMVGPTLPEAVAWLLERRLKPAPAGGGGEVAR